MPTITGRAQQVPQRKTRNLWSYVYAAGDIEAPPDVSAVRGWA